MTRDRPRRTADGRLATVADLLGTALAGWVCGVVVLLGFEAVMALARVGRFGDSSGWLALILPVWLFVEEFRAAGYGWERIVVAPLAAGFAGAAGLGVAGLPAGALPPLVGSAAGAAVTTVLYCLIWFYGLRWLVRRVPEGSGR